MLTMMRQCAGVEERGLLGCSVQCQEERNEGLDTVNAQCIVSREQEIQDCALGKSRRQGGMLGHCDCAIHSG